MNRPASSSSSTQRLPNLNQLPLSSSSPTQRLPSFRDLNNPIQQAFLNKTKVFNKKTYVPNLFVSRNVPPKVIEENALPVSTKKESRSRRGRREQKLLAPVETLVPATAPTRNSLSIKSRSKITSGDVVVKHQNVDRTAVKKVLTKQLPTKFEVISSALTQDLPVSIPKLRVGSVSGTTTKINPLLTDILKFDESDSPLFLLKTPRYIPAVLDDSKNHPKLGTKDEKTGYKCTVHDLPEGQIGKLQILKSGKLRLVLGDCKFGLHKGVKINFREELAIVKTDPETRSGSIISLGEIKERIMVVPDIVTKLN